MSDFKTTDPAGPKARPTLVRLLLGGVGLVAGAGFGALLAKLDADKILLRADLSWSDSAALWIGMALAVMGLVMLVISFNRKATGRIIDPNGVIAASPSQITFQREQAIVSLLAGLMLMTPVVIAAIMQPVPKAFGLIAIIGLLAVFLLQTALNLSVWRRADELMRRMIAEAGATCFWILQAALFLWAAAEKLGVAPPLSAWDMTTVLMGVYLTVSSILSIRRGFS